MDTLADQVADIYLANELKTNPTPVPTSTPLSQEPVKLSELELQRYVGIYWNPITESLWMITLKDGKLVDPGGGGSVLLPIAGNRFRVVGQPVELFFEMTREGTALNMIKNTKGGKPQIYKAVERVTPSLKKLAEYVGAYYSDELESTYRFEIEGGVLILHRDKAKPIQLFPTFADNFWNDNFGYVRFTRDDHNHVNGFLLTIGWIRRLRFTSH
jgi:hypothetical protein